MHRRGLLAASLTIPLSSSPLSSAAPALAAAPETPVVLELFTSQGCSSCPPADALLGQLTRQPGVIALAWHVDYWNGLGWRDSFARREWTDRQRSYAKALNEDVYTPALIVNGEKMLVGSDESAVRLAIGQAGRLPVSVVLHRTPSRLEAEIGATATPVAGLLVTYDPTATTDVRAGENQGRRLTEYRVARDVQRLDNPGLRTILPSVPDGRGVVLLIQDASLHIVGAADLAPAADSSIAAK
jgi:hypothetical protein